MFVLPPSTRVFLCMHPADMRRGFDGLAAMTRDLVAQNPLSGHLFVFRNRSGDRLKILFWERAGFCLVYRRLEKGTFRFPHLAPASAEATEGKPAPPASSPTTTVASRPESASLEIDGGVLAMILEGIELDNARRGKRFSLPVMGKSAP